MLNKFLSRKFLLALAAAICLVLKEGLGIDVDTGIVMSFVALILGYIFTEGVADIVQRNGTLYKK